MEGYKSNRIPEREKGANMLNIRNAYHEFELKETTGDQLVSEKAIVTGIEAGMLLHVADMSIREFRAEKDKNDDYVTHYKASVGGILWMAVYDAYEKSIWFGIGYTEDTDGTDLKGGAVVYSAIPVIPASFAKLIVNDLLTKKKRKR